MFTKKKVYCWKLLHYDLSSKYCAKKLHISVVNAIFCMASSRHRLVNFLLEFLSPKSCYYILEYIYYIP